MRTKKNTVALDRGVHDRLVWLVIEFVRETIKLREENAALRAQINSQ